MKNQDIQLKKNWRFWYCQLTVNILLCISGVFGILAEDEGWPIIPIGALLIGLALEIPLFFFKQRVYHLYYL